MDPVSLRLVRKAFSDFYSTWTPEPVDRVAEREFGYIPFGGSMTRHVSYKTVAEVIAGMRMAAPLSAYMSNAFYEFPKAPMEEKGWLGTLLDFDIDADHIQSPCTNEHDSIICKNCFTAVDTRKRKCPKCGSTDLQKLRFFCRVCLGSAKEHAKRAVQILTADFGVSKPAISVYFSGSRGYHIHVDDQRFLKLNTDGRTEITDYMLENDIALNVKTLKDGYAGGWYRRLAKDIDVSDRKTSTISPSGVVVRSTNVEVDPSVTNDIHRILRMPKTLHGSTGMLKKRVTDIDSFDPLTEAVVFDDEMVPVTVRSAPRFELKGKSYGPFSSESTLLPKHAAIYLVLKDVASVASTD